MSDHASAAERAVLDRARDHLIAQRRGYHRRLEHIAALDDLGTAVSTGYRSTEALIADRDNLDAAEAKRLVGEAADLCERTSMQGVLLPARLPATAAALAAGLIDPAHVKIVRETMRHLAGLLDPPPPGELAGVEDHLAEQAQVLRPRMLRVLAQGFVDFYDPDGAAPPDGEDAGDELRLHRRRDGSLVIKARLADPLDAEMVVEVFGVLAAPAGSEDARSPEARNAEAFKDLVQDARGPRGLATDPSRADAVGAGADADEQDGGEQDGDEQDGDGTGDDPAPALIPEPRRVRADRGWTERPGRALLTVTIDHRWLCGALATRGGYGTLDSGPAVDAATVRRWACDAEIVPMVLGSRSEPLDVGRTQRTAPDAIRRALNLRDGGCAFPGCSRPPRRCQAHHVRHWLDDGDTALDNMCLLCRFHHRLIHHGHWTVRIREGRPWFTPPEFVDTERRPRPGGRPRVPT